MVRVLCAALMVSGFVAGAPAPSEACVNEVELSTDQRAELLARAESDLARGRLASALENATEAGRELRGQDDDEAGLVSRAERVRAIAVVRLDGPVDATHTRVRRSIDQETRRQNLAWAARVLGPRNELPADRARYAEALSRIDARAEEAVQILEDLAARDLMPDAWAYRALAEARTRTGDPDGARAATGECRARSRRDAAICRVVATPRV
jgi:hypothetical protein